MGCMCAGLHMLSGQSVRQDAEKPKMVSQEVQATKMESFSLRPLLGKSEAYLTWQKENKNMSLKCAHIHQLPP